MTQNGFFQRQQLTWALMLS